MTENYFRKQNNCEFYLVKTDFKLYMIDDIVHILNTQRETIQHLKKMKEQLEKEHTRLTNQLRLSYDKINDIQKDNEQLKSEIKKLDTFKKILDFAEKDMEERADWQAYCEKEFEGL